MQRWWVVLMCGSGAAWHYQRKKGMATLRVWARVRTLLFAFCIPLAPVFVCTSLAIIQKMCDMSMPLRFSRFQTVYNHPVNKPTTPLGNAGKARTRRRITDIDQHLQTQVVRALNKADAHFRNATALLENRNTRDMKRKFARLRNHISRGNMYLQTGKNMARALDLNNLKNRSVQINRKASHLRPRRYS